MVPSRIQPQPGLRPRRARPLALPAPGPSCPWPFLPLALPAPGPSCPWFPPPFLPHGRFRPPRVLGSRRRAHTVPIPASRRTRGGVYAASPAAARGPHSSLRGLSLLVNSRGRKVVLHTTCPASVLQRLAWVWYLGPSPPFLSAPNISPRVPRARRRLSCLLPLGPHHSPCQESPRGGSGAHREFPKEAPLVAQPLPWAFLGLCLLKLPKEMTPLQAIATATTKFSRQRGLRSKRVGCF